MKTSLRLRYLWHRFRAGRPGDRFQKLYRARCNGQPSGWPAGRIASVTGTFALLFLGLLMIPAPGPGGLVVLFAAALLASEFLFIARSLDYLEQKVRSWWR